MVFEQPQFKKDGWLETYIVRLVSPNLKDQVSVNNAPYDKILVEYFEDLSKNWTGWEGEKTWRALEDEFFLNARILKTGQVSLTTSLNVIPYSWQAVAELNIEAGRLEDIYKKIRGFFGW